MQAWGGRTSVSPTSTHTSHFAKIGSRSLQRGAVFRFADKPCRSIPTTIVTFPRPRRGFMPRSAAPWWTGVMIISAVAKRSHRRHRPPPHGGYREESKVLSFTAMLAQGCKASEATLRCSFPKKGAGQRGRLAVLVTGIKNRYYPRSAFKHVVAPAAREGYEVDYFALLDWKSAITTDRISGQAVGVFNPLHADNKREARSLPNPQFANASVRQGLSLLSRLARASGASSLYLQFLDPGLQEDPPRKGCNRYLGQGSAEVMNYRRTRLTYKNVEVLWNITLERLKRKGLAAYNHVLWQREDAHWVSDLHLDLFQDPWTVSGFSMSGACEAAPSIPPEGHISDKVFLAGEVAAGSFFNLYDLVNCGNPNPELSRVRHPEHFIVEATRTLGLKFQVVPWSLLPVIIARHVQIYGYSKSEAAFCLKFSRFSLFRPSGPCVSADLVPYRGCHDVWEGLHDRAVSTGSQKQSCAAALCLCRQLVHTGYICIYNIARNLHNGSATCDLVFFVLCMYKLL